MSNMYFVTSDSLSDFMEVKYIIWAGDIEDLVLPGTWTIPAGQKKLKSECPHMPDSIKTLWQDPEDSNYVILPDMTGRFCMMETDPTGVGVLHEAQAPNITGQILFRATANAPSFRKINGVFQDLDPQEDRAWWSFMASNTYAYKQFLNFNASLSSSIYTNNGTVRPQCYSILVLLRI